MLAKSISPIVTTSIRLSNCPYALKTHFTYCHHLQPPFQVPPCTQKTFHQVPPAQTPLTTAPMPSKQSSSSAITSKPILNCLHALQTRFTHCHQLHTPCRLPPCPPNTFQRLPPLPTPFSTAPMPSEHISPGATTSNPLFEGSHAEAVPRTPWLGYGIQPVSGPLTPCTEGKTGLQSTNLMYGRRPWTPGASPAGACSVP